MTNPSAPQNSNRNLLLLFQGHVVSKIGTAVFDIAMVLWMTHHGVSAGVIGLVMMASKLPEILLSPLSGSIVDLTSRKKVLVAADFVVGVIILGISGACLAFPRATGLQFALIVSGAVCIGVCDSFFNPAVSSFIPELASPGRLQSVNSLYRFLTTAATFAGQCVAGLLFTALGAPILFLVNGLSYLFSSGSEAMISTPLPSLAPNGAAGHPVQKIWGHLKEGLAYVRRYHELQYVLGIICLYHFFVSPFTVILPFYVSDVIKMPPGWYGYFMAAFGAGLLAGFTLAGTLRTTGTGQSGLVTGCFGISALCYLSIGLFPYPGLTLILLFITGLCIAMIVVTLNTIVQVATPNTMQGRIFGVYHTLSTASIPVGMGCFGMALDVLQKSLPDPSAGPEIIFQFCGAMLLAVFSVFIRKPAFQNFLKTKPNQDLRNISDLSADRREANRGPT